jgi:multicomponent Na+:H+ antiporter subunit D
MGFNGPLQTILLVFGAVSAAGGALAALPQKNFKRMLAYSSISQMGYILMGIGAANPLALMGAAFHLFNHSIFKTQLFVNAAAVEKSSGTLDMDKLGGLSSRMPVTGATSLIAFLSTAGIPPLSGFWSKLLIIIGLWMAGYKAFALIAILASVVTLAYLLSMQRRVFFGKITSELSHIKEAGFALTAPAVILALITIGAGIFFPFVLEKLIMPVKALLG